MMFESRRRSPLNHSDSAVYRWESRATFRSEIAGDDAMTPLYRCTALPLYKHTSTYESAQRKQRKTRHLASQPQQNVRRKIYQLPTHRIIAAVYLYTLRRTTHNPSLASFLFRGLCPSQTTILHPEAAQATGASQSGKNFMLKMLIVDQRYSRLISSLVVPFWVVEVNIGHDFGSLLSFIHADSKVLLYVRFIR